MDLPCTDLTQGIRLNGTFGSYREAASACTVDDDGRKVDVKAGDKIFCSFVSLLVFCGCAGSDTNGFEGQREQGRKVLSKSQ